MHDILLAFNFLNIRVQFYLFIFVTFEEQAKLH